MERFSIRCASPFPGVRKARVCGTWLNFWEKSALWNVSRVRKNYWEASMSDEKPEGKFDLTGEADYRFLSLVMSLSTAAWAQLGKVPHPVTQKIEKDVEQARISIEFLRMLQEKTEGNLSVKEQELIDNMVSDLE